MRGTSGRIAKVLLLMACSAFLLAHAAHRPRTGTSLSKTHKRFARLKARAIVTPNAEDEAFLSSLLASEDPEAPNEDNGQSGTIRLPPGTETGTSPALTEGGQQQKATVTDEEECEVSPSTSAGSTGDGSVTAGEGGTVAAWMRPDRLTFDGVEAPFAVADGDDITWFKIGEENGATTIAAQQVKEITDYKGAAVTATIGDVMIFQNGAIAEAIGTLLPDGAQGEMYNIIACNVQNDNGKCIMVDYDGTNVKGTMSKTIVGQTQTLTMGSPTVIPEALNKWAANVLVLDVSTVTAGPVARRQ